MSLASSPDGFLRPEDKALQMLFPTVETQVSNSFDEFFNQASYGGSDNEDAIKIEDQADDCFAADVHALTNQDNSYYATASHSKRSPLQPWRKGLWCLNQKLDACLRIRKTRKPLNAPPGDTSPAFLTAQDDPSLSSSNPSGRPEGTKSVNPTKLNKQRDLQDMNHSPSPMYSHIFLDSGSDHVNAWQQDFQNFNIHAGEDNSDGYTSHYVPYEDLKYNPNFAQNFTRRPSGMEAIRAATIHNMSREIGYGPADPNYAAAQSYSTIMNSNLAATSRNMFSSTPDQNDASFRFITEDLPGMSDWTSESMHSSNSSHNSNFSHSSLENQRHAMYHASQPTARWSPSKTAVYQQVNPVLEQQYSNLAQPKPHRATHNVLRYNYGGSEALGQEFSSPEEVGIAIPYHPPDLIGIPQSTHLNDGANYINALASYPPLPPPVHTFDDDSPFTTPRRRNRNHSRTPSPPPSPTLRSSRSLRQRSPNRRDASQHRRKSMHRSGPIKDGSETPRHRSLSRPPRTPKTPKTPNDGFGSIGFVNFTPKDAAKLLNDVAPSGSSKTRARREQEAREKRKKLSEAAMNAVRDAGGDVSALQRVIMT